jgi:hypothetical protein
MYERHNVPEPEADEPTLERQPMMTPDLPPNMQARAVQAGASRTGRDATDQLINTTLENLTGVSARWLAGVKPFFRKLIQAARDERVTDAELVQTLEAAQKQFPELFNKLNKEALAEALEASMGAACVNGAVKGFLARSSPRSPDGAKREVRAAMTTVEFNLKDTARPELKKLLKKATDPIPGLNIAGRAIANLLKAHYRQRDQEGNKLGGDRTHYWKSVGKGVQAPQAVAADTVRVAINHPSILQKIFGGVIRAKRGKALDNPDSSPGLRASRKSVLEEKLGLKLFRVKETLVAKGADGKLTAYYVLKKSVTQRPDPKALPERELIQKTAEEKFFAWLKA